MALKEGNAHPRQRMINLMYLVFIAMLAIQIDQEVLRSYNDVKDSLQNTTTLTQQKNKMFEQTLAAKAQNSPESFGPAFQNYQKLKIGIDNLVSLVDTDKAALNKLSGNNPNAEVNFNVLNNTAASTRFFFNGGNETEPSKSSASLMKSMENLKVLVKSIFPNTAQNKPILERVEKSMATAFDTKNQKRNNKNWIQYKFYNQPLVAALSNLEIIAAEARNIQSDALANMLQEKVDANIQFDAFQPMVVAPNVVLQGSDAPVKVMIGSYATSVKGLAISGTSVVDGQGLAKLNTSTVGDQVFQGTITFLDVNGKPHTMKYSHPYTVFAGAQEVKLQSGALLSATKMNVLYRGIANPVSGSILGADNSQVSLSASGGASVSGGKGSWTVTPHSGNTVSLTISGRDPKGKVITSKFDFRIKPVPPPVAEVRGKSVNTMPVSSLPNQTVSVSMPDFDFPVSFDVTGFKLKVPGRATISVRGDKLSGAGAALKNLQAGDVIYIFDVEANATGVGRETTISRTPAVINIQ